jgi:hypothetical protein
MQDQFWNEVDAELVRARAKFPSTHLVTTALSEEYGEAVRAVLEHYYVSGKTEASTEMVQAARAAVRKELVQTAAMAVRLEEEGDEVHHVVPSSIRLRAAVSDCIGDKELSLTTKLSYAYGQVITALRDLYYEHVMADHAYGKGAVHARFVLREALATFVATVLALENEGDVVHRLTPAQGGAREL